MYVGRSAAVPEVSETLYMSSILPLYSFQIGPKLRSQAQATRARKSNENIVGLRFLTFYSKSSKSTLKKGTACLYGLLCSG